MPQAKRASKPGGKGGMLIGIVIIVILLAGAGVGAYLWNRSSAVATAEKFMQAGTAVFKTGSPDFETLKRILVKDQAAQVEQSLGPIANLTQGPWARFLTSITATYQMGEAEVGLREATVNATLTLNFGGRTMSPQVKIALVREGLAWKVDAKKTQASAAGGPAPRL